MRSAHFIFLALALAPLAACASDPWASYHDSLHDAISDNTRGSRVDHAEHLDRIVTRHELLGTRPPPGVYAELAYYLTRLGDPTRGDELMTKEVESYPESAKFVGMLRQLLADPDLEAWPGEDE